MTCLLAAAAHADNPKPDAADKAISEAAASLKAQAAKTKDESEQRKLTAAAAALEELAKKPPKTDNHLLQDFIDSEAKYAKAKAKLTFLVKVDGTTASDVGTIRDWRGASRKFTATTADNSVRTVLEIDCPDAVLKAGPAARPGESVIVTFAHTETGWQATEIKRP